MLVEAPAAQHAAGLGLPRRETVDAAAAGAPESVKPFIADLFAPFMSRLDHAFFEAFSGAIGQTFLVGVVTTLAAAAVLLFMRELPLRRTRGPQPAAAALPRHGAAAAGESATYAPGES